MYAGNPRLVLVSDIQIVDAICLFALLSLHTLQCFHSLTNRQTHSLTLCTLCILCIHCTSPGRSPRISPDSPNFLSLWSPITVLSFDSIAQVFRKRKTKQRCSPQLTIIRSMTCSTNTSTWSPLAPMATKTRPTPILSSSSR